MEHMKYTHKDPNASGVASKWINGELSLMKKLILFNLQFYLQQNDELQIIHAQSVGSIMWTKEV